MAKTDLRNFDYRKVAQYDSGMWRAYYNHQFLKMTVLLLKTIRSQLGLNWWLTVRLAFYSGWAATDYRLRKGNENYGRVLKNLVKFYKIISNNCSESFDYKKTAELELEWWNIHRYPNRFKKSLDQSLAEAAAAMYSTNPAKLKDYAKYRGEAMLLPDHEGDDQPNPPDYNKITDILIKSWGSLHKAVNEKV